MAIWQIWTAAMICCGTLVILALRNKKIQELGLATPGKKDLDIVDLALCIALLLFIIALLHVSNTGPLHLEHLVLSS